MGRRLPPDQYQTIVDRMRDCIRLYVPPKAIVLVASKGDEELVRVDGYCAWHFPQTETGVYAGHHPADSREAIAHLHDLQARGARYLVFPASAMWWLDHYRDLEVHLNTRHTRTVSVPGVCVVYELDPAVIPDEDTDREGERDPAALATAEPATILRPTQQRGRAAPRVLSILARFGADQYAHAARDVADIFRQQMPSVDRTSVVVDNALPPGIVEEGPEGVIIGGDNSAREFSAFDRALEFVGGSVWSYDLVHLATSAFKTLHTAYLDRFTVEILAAAAARPVCVGHIDCFNDPIEILSFRSQHWIRSCFFMLSPEEVKALGGLATVRDGSRFFSGDPAQPFRADAPIGETFREYITTWLTGGDVGQGVTWHSSFPITRDTLNAFEQKALSILNEHLLSVRLRALGCRLIDVSWLSAALRRGAAHIPWDSGWREQISTRVDTPLDLESRRVAMLSTV